MRFHHQVPSGSRAQGMVEYIVIIVVVDIFCIGIFMAMGRGVQEQTGHTTRKLVGQREHNAKLNASGTSYQLNVQINHRKGGMGHEGMSSE